MFAQASLFQTIIINQYLFQSYSAELSHHVPSAKGQATTATWLEQLLEKTNIRPQTAATHQGAPALSLALHCESQWNMLLFFVLHLLL